MSGTHEEESVVWPAVSRRRPLRDLRDAPVVDPALPIADDPDLDPIVWWLVAYIALAAIGFGLGSL